MLGECRWTRPRSPWPRSRPARRHPVAHRRVARGGTPGRPRARPAAGRRLRRRGPLARTFAVVVVLGGRVVAERYAGELEHFDRPPDPVDVTTPLLSWSVAKSMLHAATGLLVGDGAAGHGGAGPGAPMGRAGDPRRAITVEHLLTMRDGLAFTEDYVDSTVSDVIEMLFGSGQADTAAFAADRPLQAGPGQHFNYSSGTTNIVSGVLARQVGPGDPYLGFLTDRLLAPSAPPGPARLRRGGHLGRLLLRARHGPRLRPLRPPLPPRRGVGGRAAPAAGLGGPRPAGPLGRPRRRRPLRRPLVGGRRPPTAPSRRSGYEGQRSRSAPPSTSCSSAWARPPRSAAPWWRTGGRPWSTPSPRPWAPGPDRPAAVRPPRRGSRGRGR